MTDATASILQFCGSIVVAIITGGLAFLGTTKAAKANNSKILTELKAGQKNLEVTTDLQIADIKKDILRLEQKQDKHNNIIERVYKIEQRLDDMKRAS